VRFSCESTSEIELPTGQLSCARVMTSHDFMRLCRSMYPSLLKAPFCQCRNEHLSLGSVSVKGDHKQTNAQESTVRSPNLANKNGNASLTQSRNQSKGSLICLCLSMRTSGLNFTLPQTRMTRLEVFNKRLIQLRLRKACLLSSPRITLVTRWPPTPFHC
jgi:hypothetical protein